MSSGLSQPQITDMCLTYKSLLGFRYDQHAITSPDARGDRNYYPRRKNTALFYNGMSASILSYIFCDTITSNILVEINKIISYY